MASFDQIVFRGNTQLANELTVSGAFDVNGNMTVSTDGALSGVSTIGSSGLATLGSISCDTGMVLTDGMGKLTVTSVTDGTCTMEMGGLTGLDSLTATNAVQGGSLTDGTASLESGSLTSAINVTCSGIVSSAQLKVNQSSTISSDGMTYCQCSNGPDNGSCIIQITCNTEDDANGIWMCSKVTGSAGTLSKLGGTPGSTSMYGLSGQWTDMEKPSFKYTTEWSGGMTMVPFKATILGC